MLPRVAPTTGALQPSLALQAGTPIEAAVKPQLSAATLANLRAEVLLRLIETMLKHLPRTSEPSPSRDLLETLLAALKTLPGREGEGGRKLADLLAKLPPELRPSVEKLIVTVLSAMPTRSLVEVVRNPNGPEAQKLAILLTASLDAGDRPAAGAERQQKPLALTAQQLAAVGRHGPQQTAQATQIAGDARVLQTVLKRIFDLDSGSKPRTATTTRAVETALARPAAFAGTNRLPVQANTTARTELHVSAPIAKVADRPPVDATEADARDNADVEETQKAAPAVKREEPPAKAQTANAAGQALARSVLQAVARDLPPALVMQAVAHLVENLSPEEAKFLQTLLERPIDPAAEQNLTPISTERPEQVAEQAVEAEPLAEGGKVRAETTQSTPALPRQTAELDDALPLPQARETVRTAVAADTMPERLLAATVLPREGVPLAFVPYLPAEEDLEWFETRDTEQDEDQADGEGEGDGEDADPDASGGEPEDAGPEAADMVRRREKTAEMVGVIEPGLVFYQKLGDYWT
ncbi:hypothetical protein [Shinella sp.]|uniref:hypothetical protein n=1 Tax=Shinella sp. TaxID=1870904 RepID=UPI0029B9ADCD|nr:hypothetical protein [Shinella sp.]MDX3975868.1 hypothetical protein [Shinella sp.]